MLYEVFKAPGWEFYGYRQREVELDQRGLVLIQGVNSDDIPHQVMALESQR